MTTLHTRTIVIGDFQPDFPSGFTTGGHWHEKVVQVLHVTVTSDIHTYYAYRIDSYWLPLWYPATHPNWISSSVWIHTRFCMPLSQVTFIKVADFRFISFSVYKLTLPRSIPSVLARYCMHSVHKYTRTPVSFLCRVLFGWSCTPLLCKYTPLSVFQRLLHPPLEWWHAKRICIQ